MFKLWCPNQNLGLQLPIQSFYQQSYYYHGRNEEITANTIMQAKSETRTPFSHTTFTRVREPYGLRKEWSGFQDENFIVAAEITATQHMQ